MNRLAWIASLSLKKKLLLLLAAVGLVPLTITFFISYGELRKSTRQSQSYAANQNFEQTLATLSGILSRIENLSSFIIVNETLHAALSADPVSTDIGEQLVRFAEVSAYSQNIEATSESDSIVYYIDDRIAVAGSDTRFRKLSNIMDRKWAQKVVTNVGKPTWELYADESAPSSKSFLIVGRNLWSTRDYRDAIGIVTIRLDLKQLRQSLTASHPEQLVYLSTEDGDVIASSDDVKLGTMRLPEMWVTGQDFEEMELKSGFYMVRSNEIGNTGIYLSSVIPIAAASAAVDKVGTRMIAVYLVICVALLLFIFPVTGSITRRVFLLTRKLDQVRNGELRTLDIEHREDEVGRLVSSYNFMVNKVQELLQEQFRLGQEKIGAELKALQSQINPHFLYNTLDMLIWMAQKDEREHIQQVVYALSDYYKLILNKGDDFVSVSHELRLCEVYIEIQQRRHIGRIRFEADVEETAKSCLIPKITLQPLVENAIVHGISENAGGKGTIVIKGAVSNHRLMITVEDDGDGMNAQKIRRPGYIGSGYGLKNIEKRLELYFGERNCMQVESVRGIGTRVTIHVPVVNDARKV